MSLFGFPANLGYEERLNEDERIARLRLCRTKRIGPVHFYQLISRFGSAIAALEALPQLSKRAGGEKIVPPDLNYTETEIEQGTALGARYLVLGDQDYPQLLRHIDAAPPVLWFLGPLTPKMDAVAVVGARNASAAGQKIASQLSQDLGQSGFHIVSGLARGIDTKAHEGALSTGTLAVLGGGIADVYPPQNEGLYRAIAHQGLIISESPPLHHAQAKDFPRRNRLISGLSKATIVVEAELRSGSLITARLALEQNRELFSVPGSPLDPRCRGTNDLLRKGAHVCENADDVRAVVQSSLGFVPEGFAAPAPSPYALSPKLKIDDTDLDTLRRRLLGLMGQNPMGRDELLRALGAPISLSFAALSELEITGQVIALEGGAYIRA
jgi:DNA processing protein